MKRIIIIFILILVTISGKSQSYGKYFWAKDYVRSPYFISGGDTIAQWQKRGLNAVFLGNVGIGTPTPNGILGVKGSSRFSIPETSDGIFSINSYFTGGIKGDIFALYTSPDKLILFDEEEQGYNVLIGNTDTTEYKEKLTVNGKVKVNQYIRQGGVYGTMWTNDSEVSLSTSAYYQKLEAFTVNGLYNYTFPDHTTDRITVFESGKYLVTLSGSLTCSGDALVRLAFYIDQMVDENILIDKYIHANNYNDFSVTGTLYIGEDSQLEVAYKIYQGTNPLEIHFSYLNLTISYLGE